MVLEFLANIDAMLVLVAFIIFVIFILSIKHVIKTTQNFTGMVLRKLRTLAIVVIAAMVFPVVGDRLLGLAITADIPTIKIFALGGIALYVVYLLGLGIYKGLSFAEKKMPSLPKKDKKFDKLIKVEKEKNRKLDELQKKIEEGKKMIEEDEGRRDAKASGRSTIISDGDTSKFLKKGKKKKSFIKPLKEINYEDLEEED